jgi:small ligand-binding sensory domain FIST
VPFASGLSEHPIPAHAVGEAVGQVLEQLDGAPDVVVVFATAAHVGAFDDIAGAVAGLLGPQVLLGVTASAVVGGAREIEDRPAISLWAANLGPVVPVRLATVAAPGGWTIRGLPTDATAQPHALVLLADPFTFPADGLLDQLAVSAPDLVVIGGLASAGRGPGGNRLALRTPGEADPTVYTDGAVGLLLAGTDRVSTVVSQGCRPVGEPYVVTRGDGSHVYELGGRPATERLESTLASLDPATRSNGVHVGRVIDEHRADFGRGDFIIRTLVGLDRGDGAIVVGERVEVGSTLQFQVRDALTADEDLRALLSDEHGDSALVFTCSGRGTNLFDGPDHDARVVAQAVDGRATAGMFCAGELGPVAGRNFLHGFTASVALFHER